MMFISWAMIKQLTKSESVPPKRGIEAHFLAHLQPSFSKFNSMSFQGPLTIILNHLILIK